MNANGLKGRVEKLEQQYRPRKAAIVVIPLEDGETLRDAQARVLTTYGSLRGCIFANAHDVAL